MKSGRIRYFGCSNWRASRIIEADEYAKEHRLKSFSVNQLLWNMAVVDMGKYPWPGCTNMDDDAYKYHIQSGLAAFAYESQARGFFHKMHNGAEENISKALSEQYKSEKNKKRLNKALELCKETGKPLTVVILSYLLSQPFPSAAQITSSSVEQLNDSLQNADFRLTKEQLAFIESE